MKTGYTFSFLWGEGKEAGVGKDRAKAELLQGFDNPALATAWIWLLRTVVPLMLAVTLYFAILALGPAAMALFS